VFFSPVSKFFLNRQKSLQIFGNCVGHTAHGFQGLVDFHLFGLHGHSGGAAADGQTHAHADEEILVVHVSASCFLFFFDSMCRGAEFTHVSLEAFFRLWYDTYHIEP